jgi:hypothetical protein
MTQERLMVGDEVLWRGSWGKDPAKITKVTGIELCDGRSKYGVPVNSIEWKGVLNGNVNITVDLSNGNWAYGTQINPLK